MGNNTDTPSNTQINSNINDKYVDFGSEKYRILIFIDLKNLIVRLEPTINRHENIFQNSLTLEESKDLHPTLSGYNELEDIKNVILDLLIDGEIKVEVIENQIFLNIKRRIIEISIPLKKYDEKKVITYNTLSEEMKRIIDKNEIILGIDLGTTYSCASVMLDNKVFMIQNSLGLRVTPSYVWFLEPNKVCIGELAKLQPSYECKNIIYNTKRFFGRNMNDEEIKKIESDLPFDIKQDDELNHLKISINFNKSENKPKEYYPEQISALILKKLINDSEYYLAKKLNKEIKIKNAVITVPAYFNQKQREATYQAAEIIGLNIKRMINEPTAASLAYGINSCENDKKLITVLDFGGGTLDLTLLQFIKNENGIYYDIKFSYGNTHFGGEDFDNILMERCLKSLRKEGIEINSKLQCNVRLKRACEMAKIKLSTCEFTNITLEEYDKNVNINFSLTRKQFENYCKSIFDKFEKILLTFLESSGYNNKDISEVILIGGSTLIPKIEEIITHVFKFSKIKKNLNPKEAVAKGAAIQAAMLSNLSSVNRMGLLDVTNLSLGIKELGNKMSKIIKRSTPIPEETFKIYRTVEDNQEGALIEVFEGEDESTKNNLLLDKFYIRNLPLMEKGEVKIKVNFSIDNNSILKVTAYDLQEKNHFEKLEINRPKGLRDKIERLKEENEKIEIIDIEEYNDFKDSIIALEEEILQNKTKGEMKKINSKIIKKFGEFIEKVKDKISREKIVISYLKYYFIKVMKYMENEEEDEAISNFCSILKIILGKIQFSNTALLFEIIEIFVDDKYLYPDCIIQLLENYFDKISNEFYNLNILLKNEPNNYQKPLDILNELNDKIIFLQRFYNNIQDKERNSSLLSIKDGINELFLKIGVKKIIIGNKQNPIDITNEKEKSKLEELFVIYKQCRTNIPTDLNELENIIKLSENNISYEDLKANNFIENFDRMKDDDMFKFLFIFQKYDITKYSADDLVDKITNLNKREDLILELCDKYQKYNYNNSKGEKTKEAITKIQAYLNKLKKKCEDKNKPLFIN